MQKMNLALGVWLLPYWILRNKQNKMRKVILYSLAVSPPCRSVLLAAKQIGVPLDVRTIRLLEDEHMTKEYTEVNPQRLIPGMDDNGFTLGDSHAIVCYLVDKYAKNDALYPKDLQTRARINQLLHMDSSMLFAHVKLAYKPLIFGLTNSISEEKMNYIRESYETFNRILEGKKWLVGDSYTVADICCLTTTASVMAVLNIDDYPNVKAWFERAENKIPGFKEQNDNDNDMLVELVRAKLG